jgi:hypothetical protein
VKFKLEIEDGKKTVVLVPENTGEQQLLAAIHPHQDTNPHDIDAVAVAEQSNDRPPYRRITALRIEVKGG